MIAHQVVTHCFQEVLHLVAHEHVCVNTGGSTFKICPNVVELQCEYGCFQIGCGSSLRRGGGQPQLCAAETTKTPHSACSVGYYVYYLYL